MSTPSVDRRAVTRFWLWRQGLSDPRSGRMTRARFVDHLERTGGLQLDSVNVLDRAHYTTLWSRFGTYDRGSVDRWAYDDRVAYEYWGHEASLLPAGHLPYSLRGMRNFRRSGKWWDEHRPSQRTIRHVLARIRAEGALESRDFEDERPRSGSSGWWNWKEAKRALELLWFRGQLAVASRRHFRRRYDLAERVYPEGDARTTVEYHDSWLLRGLAANGPAPDRHLVNYFTAPRLKAPERKRVIARNLRKKRVREVTVDGETWLALPEHLDRLAEAPEPAGTTLLCPFDSALWQRQRAEDLLDFRYRIEIYVPAPKRVHGYYCLPILHEGRLVGRLDPKLHRDREALEVRSVHLEPGFRGGRAFERALSDALEDLARFNGATSIERAPTGR